MKETTFQDIRLIAADMDHTLLTEESRIPPDFPKYVKKLNEKGIRFVIASGRPMYTLKSMFLDLQEELIFMSDNGGAISYQGKMIYKNLMKIEDYQEIIRFVEEKTDGVSVLCAMEQAYVLKKYQKYEPFFRTFLSELAFVDEMRNLTVEANKFSAYFPEKNSAQLYDKIFLPRYGDNFSVTVGGEEWVDLMNPGVNKGMGMKQIGDIFDIAPEQMMAFGDTYNDIEMLQYVKYGFVMENAAPEMRKYTDYVAPSNEEYGVLKVVDRVLKEREE